MTRNPHVCFQPSLVKSLVNEEDLPPFSNMADGGKRQVVPLYGFQPHSPLINGWRPDCYYTALLLVDNDWNPVVAPFGNGWAVIGGVNWSESAMVAMERGSLLVMPEYRIWTVSSSNRREVEICELMRLYFQRQRLKQAKFRAHALPDFASNRLASLSSEEFMSEALAYLDAVHGIWQTV